MQQRTAIARPKEMDSFIGQQHAINVLKVALVSSLRRNDALPHIIFSGPPGLGKTTLAEILAAERKVPIQSFLATSITTDRDIDLLFSDIVHEGYDDYGRITDLDKVHPPIIFLDEIHRLSGRVTECLHTALEDYLISLCLPHPETGIKGTHKYWIPRFTMIGATNYLGSLPKPFLDRFPIQLTFQHYSVDEMLQVVGSAASNIEMEFDKDALEVIAQRSRGTPRIGERLLLACRDAAIALPSFGKVSVDCVNYVLDIRGIDQHGLDQEDRKVLNYLMQMARPVGLNTICSATDIDKGTMEMTIEPWLMKEGYINRTPRGRSISEKGRRLISQQTGNRTGIRMIS